MNKAFNKTEGKNLELAISIEETISSLNSFFNAKLQQLRDELQEIQNFYTDSAEKLEHELIELKSILSYNNNLFTSEWIHLLGYQQDDFRNRLKVGINNLSTTKVEGLHSELITISKERVQIIKEFCWEISDKYKKKSTNKIKEIFINNLKGKLAEEAIRQYLGKLVDEVNYEINHGGDGKVDLVLSKYPDICLQVKCRQGKPDDVFWNVSVEEAQSNCAIVCVLVLEDISESQEEYTLLIAGFIPTIMLNIQSNTKRININDLLYINGLIFFLNKTTFTLNQEKSNIIELSLSERQAIWQRLLESLNRPSRALFCECTALMYLNDCEAKIVVNDGSVFRLVQKKISEVEIKLQSILDKNIEISLCLLSLENGADLILDWLYDNFNDFSGPDVDHIITYVSTSTELPQKFKNEFTLYNNCRYFDKLWNSAICNFVKQV